MYDMLDSLLHEVIMGGEHVEECSNCVGLRYFPEVKWFPELLLESEKGSWWRIRIRYKTGLILH